MNRRSNGRLTMICQSKRAVQAEAPMTATGEGPLSPESGRGAHLPFFCFEIPRGPGQSPGLAGQRGRQS
jgi:hypothetical protein